jgi:threonine dehydratase
MSGLLPGNGVNLFFKMENLQHTGSFKLRGATNKIMLLTAEQAGKGVIAASNGNHGLGVAAAAKRTGISAEIYVSSHVPPAKARRIEEYGAVIRRAGADPLEAELAARSAAEQAGKVFISPYNDLDVIAGQGTIAVELQRQRPGIDAIFVAVGGGGLIGGIGGYVKLAASNWQLAASQRQLQPQQEPQLQQQPQLQQLQQQPQLQQLQQQPQLPLQRQGLPLSTEIVGCWAENSRVLFESLKVGRVIDFPEQPTLSESTAGGLEPGSVTLDVCKQVIDRCVLVTEDEIAAALRRVRDEKGWKIEGAAGVALAAFLKTADQYHGKTVVVVICGGNTGS